MPTEWSAGAGLLGPLDLGIQRACSGVRPATATLTGTNQSSFVWVERSWARRTSRRDVGLGAFGAGVAEGAAAGAAVWARAGAAARIRVRAKAGARMGGIVTRRSCDWFVMAC